MIVQLHSGFTDKIESRASSVLVRDNLGNPLFIILEHAGGRTQLLSADEPEFKTIAATFGYHAPRVDQLPLPEAPTLHR